MFHSFSGIGGGRSRSAGQEGRASSGGHPLFDSADLRRLEEADYVRWEVPDLNGVSKSKTMTKAAVAGSAFWGVALYSGVLSFGAHGGIVAVPEVVERGHPDCLAVPREAVQGVAGWSLPAVAPVPWAGGGQHAAVVSVICDTAWKSGAVPTEDWQAANPRVIARRQLEKLRDVGFALKSAHEYEFRLFDRDSLEPVMRGNDIFNTLVFGEYEEEMMAVEAGLRAQGVMVETMQMEAGSSQFELTLTPCEGLDAADAAFRFKHAVKELFQQRQLIASFMTKPIHGEASNSCHFNHSLQPLREAGGLFSDGRLEDEADAEFKCAGGQLNRLARHWLGGLVTHAPALTALCAPTVNCYRRLHGAWAPSHGGWGEENRDMMVRLKRERGEGCYFENRLGCGASNPYLVLAATVAAGLDGITRQLEPPAADTKEGCPRLPETLPDALAALENDTQIVSALGEQFVSWFRHFKEAEMSTIDALHASQRCDRLEAEKKALLRFL